MVDIEVTLYKLCNEPANYKLIEKMLFKLCH